MKYLVVLCTCLFCTYAFAQSETQRGCVKTRGRMVNGKHIPGVGLPGAVVSVKDRNAIAVKNEDGMFSFPTTGNQFIVQSVTKKDYALVDADAAPKTYQHSSNVQFFVMETPEQLLQDKLDKERKIRRTLNRQLQDREDEIEILKAENKISQQKYQELLQELYSSQESKEKLISEMAERYTQLDYDQLDEFYRQVSNYIEEGELVKADSLLKTRGDLISQIAEHMQQDVLIQQKKEELNQAESVQQFEKEELARRCYSYFENFKMQHQHDSAAYYIELRACLDTTNLAWLGDAGTFIQDYIGNFDCALKYFKTALHHSQKVNNSKDIATSYCNIGLIYFKRGLINEALDFYNKSILHDNTPNALATIYLNIGSVLYNKGEFQQALNFFIDALNIQISLWGEFNEKVATSYANLGVVYNTMDSIDRAFEYGVKALELRKSLAGGESLDVSISLNNIGALYHGNKDYNNALEYYNNALKIKQKLLIKHHPDIATSLNNISHLYIEIKDFHKALEYQKNALEIRLKSLSPLSADIANSYNALGAIYGRLQEIDKAFENYQKALDIRIRALGENHLDVASSYNNIAYLHFQQGEFEKALHLMKKTLTIKKQLLPNDSPSLISTKKAIEMLTKKLQELGD